MITKHRTRSLLRTRWAAIGAATITMLVVSGALPLSLLGEKLFSGIDAFALTAVPLFILTGDVLVRTGLSRKFLDVAEALTCWAKGGFGSATVLVCGMFAAISGSDAAGAAAVGAAIQLLPTGMNKTGCSLSGMVWNLGASSRRNSATGMR